jgi:folylpolyglutamate synthase/dihydropteroate synthase
MIYKFQSQLISTNPIEIAEKKLKTHKEKGANSSLSIFEVANLMDTLCFSQQNEENKSNVFEICFN